MVYLQILNEPKATRKLKPGFLNRNDSSKQQPNAKVIRGLSGNSECKTGG